MMRCAFDMVSACASVLATMKSTPCSPAAIMFLTALPPAPPIPNTIMRAFISRISVMLVIFASGKLGNGEDTDCYLQALRSASTMLGLDVPVGVQLVRGYRSSRQLGHRSAEPPPHFQAVPSPPWLPSSRQSPAAAQPSGDRRARARARNLLCDRPSLLRAARSPPSMPRSLALIGRCCLPGDHLVAGAYAVFQRDQRSTGLCH